MSELPSLTNVDKVIKNNLFKVEITTPEKLRKIGSKKTSLRIRDKVDPGAFTCYMA